MLKQFHTAPASNTQRSLGFVSMLMLGIATMMPAHADIKIGFQAPLTGPSATDGKSAQIAATMAVEDIIRRAVGLDASAEACARGIAG